MKITLSPLKDKASEDGKVPLYFFFFENGKKKKLFSGERVLLPTKKKSQPTGTWDEKSRKLFETTQADRQTNFRLEQMHAFLLSRLRESQLSGSIFDIEKIKAEFRHQFFGEALTDIAVKDLAAYILDFVEQNRHRYAPGSLRMYSQVVGHIEKFSPGVQVDAVDKAWFNRYLTYLYKQGISANSIGPHITFIRHAMQLAFEAGEKVSRDFVRFSVKSNPTEKIYHSQDEVLKLIAYRDFCKNPVKDILNMYVFSCLTGIRWSDIAGLKWGNVRENTVNIRVQKTKQLKEIYLHPISKQILDYYKGTYEDRVFPEYTSQHVNRVVKKICEKLGMDEPLQRVKYVGAERIETNLPKWKMVSFHTARHTHAVVSLELGMDLVTLQDNLGHTDPKTTRIEAKIVDKKRHENTKSVWDKLGE